MTISTRTQHYLLSALADKNTRDEVVSNLNTKTSANTIIYVDAALGKDSNDGSSALPFCTIQRALDSLPKRIQHQVIVNVAAGNYAGFNVDGFVLDANALGAYLLIQGTMAVVTPTTGSATGTATAGSAQSGTTFATLTDSAATWTTNEFVGKFVRLVSGNGSALASIANYNNSFPIVSNTGTVITIAGSWGSAGTPNATTTYSIEDQATILTSPAPANTVSGFTASDSYIRVMNCQGTMSIIRQVLEIKKFKAASTSTLNVSLLSPAILPTITACSLSTTTAACVTIFDAAHAQLRFCQLGGTTQTSGNLLSIGSLTGAAGNINITDCFLRVGATTTSPHLSVLGASRLAILRSRFEGGTTSTSGVINFRDGALSGYMNQCQIDGNSSARVGIFMGVGTNSAAGAASGPVGFLVNTTKFTNCLTAAVVNGPQSLLEMRTGVVFDTCTNGINVSRGAKVQYGSTNSVSTVTNEIIVDGAAAATVTDLRAASPKVLKNSDYFTAIYE